MQCLDCSLYWEIGIVYCTWKMSNTFAEYQKFGQEELWRLINSTWRHPKKPHPWSQAWTFSSTTHVLQSQRDVRKVRQPKHGGHKTILQRWHKYDKYRTSLSQIGLTEEQIIQYDQLTLEDHAHSARRKERGRNEKGWEFKLNKEGAQESMNQWFFFETKREMKRMHGEHVKETSEGNAHLAQLSWQRRGQEFGGLEEHDYRVDPQTRWRCFPSKQQGNLSRPTPSSSSTNWEHDNNWTRAFGTGNPQIGHDSTTAFQGCRDGNSATPILSTRAGCECLAHILQGITESEPRCPRHFCWWCERVRLTRASGKVWNLAGVRLEMFSAVRPSAVENFARTHDVGLWRCLSQVLQIHPAVQETVTLPLSLGGLGLRSACTPSRSWRRNCSVHMPNVSSHKVGTSNYQAVLVASPPVASSSNGA